MDKTAAVRIWYQKWKKEEAAQRALISFHNKFKDKESEDVRITQERILFACFNAKHYQKEKDPGEEYRHKLPAEKKRLNLLAKAARILRMSAQRGDKSLMWAFASAEEASRIRITRYEHEEPMTKHLELEKYFSALETALKNPLPELHGSGPFLYKYTIGNLILKESIGRGRPILTETMLAFELAFYFRMHTAGRAMDSLQIGQKMPTDGEPCFPIVAHFCNAIFGTTWDEKHIGDNVRDLKSAELNQWQGVNWS